MTGLSFLFIVPNPTDPLNLEAAVIFKNIQLQIIRKCKETI